MSEECFRCPICSNVLDIYGNGGEEVGGPCLPCRRSSTKATEAMTAQLSSATAEIERLREFLDEFSRQSGCRVTRALAFCAINGDTLKLAKTVALGRAPIDPAQGKESR